MSWWQRLKRGRKLGLIMLVGIPITGYILLNPHGIIQRVRLELEKREMAAKLKQAELERQRLQDLAKKLESDQRTLEKVAREKYGMLREGETVYTVKPRK
jgi:cell division protein FtsB